MNHEPTKKEIATLECLSTEKRAFFDDHFGKVSMRMWSTDLKHYDDTYNIEDALCICEAFNWRIN